MRVSGLARDYWGYGYKFGSPSARGLEQLVIGHGRGLSPLIGSITTLWKNGPDAIGPFLTIRGSAQVTGQSEDSILTGFDERRDGWRKFTGIAPEILGGSFNWADHLVKHGVLPTPSMSTGEWR
jgi:hypothetical protein